MTEREFQLGITSTFVDNDAVNLVQGVVKDVARGIIPHTEVTCIVSTRATGDNHATDQRLTLMLDFLREMGSRSRISIPLIQVSAKQLGRLKEGPTAEEKDRYDNEIINLVYKRCEQLPQVVVMLGDMIIHGPEWCKRIPSLNLHPDLPLNLGGTEGIYWNVIGKWVKNKKKEGGGMIHLATPELDAGTTVAYFRIPLKGVVNEINLGDTWKLLPADEDEIERLIEEQTKMKDEPTHPLFQKLRRAEAAFEQELICRTLIKLATGRLVIGEGGVCDEKGTPLPCGLDLTREVVGEAAIWSEGGKD